MKKQDVLLYNSDKAVNQTMGRIGNTNLTELVTGRVKFYMNASPHAMCLLQSPYQTEQAGRLPDP